LLRKRFVNHESDIVCSLKGAAMSVTIAPAKDCVTGSSAPSTPAGVPAATGYRISILPAALEISARLATAEELQMLIKILQANAVIWANAIKSDRQQVATEIVPNAAD
jgi:hypothetical protein